MSNGQVLARIPTGKLMWSHVDCGDSIWASPCIAEVNGRPMLFFGSHDGNLYGFRCPPKETTQ